MEVFMKKIFLILTLVITTSSSPRAWSAPSYGTLKVSKIVRVIDGDTFVANIKGVHPIIGKNVRIRIAGINAPELSGNRKHLAYASKDYLEGLLKSSMTAELRNIRRGKYFRIVADVYCNNRNVGDALIKKGFAKKWINNRY
jgi:micrococcal nuclease